MPCPARLVLLLALTLPLGACSRPADPPAGGAPAGDPPLAERSVTADTMIPVRRLIQLSTGGPAEERHAVIGTAAEWTALWGSIETEGQQPEVDFAAEQIIVAAAGTRSSGGHEITIESVREDGNRRVVTILETAPGSGCMNTQALTQPIDVVTVPKRAGVEYTFTVRQERTPCE